MKTVQFCITALLSVMMSGCGNAPKDIIEPSEIDDDRVCLEPDKVNSPWLVGLDATDRGSVSRSISKGLMLVEKGECGTFKMLPNCYIPGISYKENMSDQLRVHSEEIKDRTLMQRKIPLAIARFSREMKTGDTWSLDYVEAGEKSYEGSIEEIDWSAVRGTCRRATHYVYMVTLGAFQLSVAKSKESETGGYVGPADWKTRSEREKKDYSDDGDYKGCASKNDPSLSECKGIIKIWVEPIPKRLLPQDEEQMSQDTEQKEKAEAKAQLEREEAGRQAEARKLEAERKAAEEAKRKAEAQSQGKAGVEWIYSKPAGVAFTKTEITLGQYKECVRAGGCKEETRYTKSDNNSCNWGSADRDNHPMNCVNWYGADQFCRWLGGESRLPTESEWYAEASNGSEKREWPWGNSPAVSCDYAIWGDGTKTYGCEKDSTWPVCSKPRGNSVSGLCDMSGNVWEWTSTDYDSSNKVLRGGSWNNGSDDVLRTSYRVRSEPSSRFHNYGFRCVRPSSKPSATSNSEEIIQPGTNLYWLKCPVGQTWNGSSCIGNAKNMDWKAAKKSCPSGYRLPTKQEFIDLLGGCDSNALEKSLGYCNKCSLSSNCNSMFSSDSLWYWSSSYHGEFVWGANFSSGKLYSFRMGGGDYVRCVR